MLRYYKTKLSIISINLNNQSGLIKTIKSVINQTYNDYEYLVIDGKSTDGSVNIIKRYSKSIHWWLSESDKGIYHAMNKGIAKATGEYCLFLNSGDYLANKTVLSNVFANNHTEDILYGSIINDYNNSLTEVQYPDEKYLTFRHFINSTLPHPCTFIKNSLFNKIGLYDENLKIVSDWEFFIKAIFLHNASIKKLNNVISVYNTDGLSSMKKNKKLIAKERDKVLETHFNRFLVDYKYIDKLEKSLPFSIYSRLRKFKNMLSKNK